MTKSLVVLFRPCSSSDHLAQLCLGFQNIFPHTHIKPSYAEGFFYGPSVGKLNP